MFSSESGRLVLQSSDSCAMWPVPEETVLSYEIHYNNTFEVRNYTTNWYCLKYNIQSLLIQVGTQFQSSEYHCIAIHQLCCILLCTPHFVF